MWRGDHQRSCRRRGTAAVACAVLLTACGHAPGGKVGGEVGTFGALIENDEIAGTDRHYTNGVRFSWTTPAGGVPDWADRIGKALPGAAPEVRGELALGQSIFTPLNRFRSDPLPTDRPYAGWLYASAGVLADHGDALDRLEMTAGIVGPSSLAEQTQKAVHELTGARVPEGWDHQLNDEPGLILSYDRVWRNILPDAIGGLDLDLAPHAGVALGNVLTYGAAGGTIRIGQGLDVDYGPPRVRPGVAGSGFVDARSGTAWYVFLGAEGRAVARNIFLDGNSFEDGPSVDRKTFVADLQAGVAIVIDGIRIAYTHVLRTKEYDDQEKTDTFGSLSVSFTF